MFNHSFDHNIHWQYDKERHGMTLMAHKDIKAGDEGFTNYGEKGNNLLWLNYGFVVPDNPNVMISLPFDLD